MLLTPSRAGLSPLETGLVAASWDEFQAEQCQDAEQPLAMAANKFSSLTSRMSSPAPALSGVPATAHCHILMITCPPMAPSCPRVMPTRACHTVHRLASGQLVDLHGHEIQVAPHAGHDNMVRATYREAQVVRDQVDKKVEQLMFNSIQSMIF